MYITLQTCYALYENHAPNYILFGILSANLFYFIVDNYLDTKIDWNVFRRIKVSAELSEYY